MLGTTGDNKLVWVFLCEFHRIPNDISPQTAGGTDYYRIVTSYFHAPQRYNRRIRLIDFLQRNKLIEHVIVNHQQHGRIVQIALQAKEAFTGIIRFHVMHLVCRNKLLVLFTIRCEAYSPVEENLQIRPYLIQMFGTRFLQHTVQHGQHPGRNSRNVGHILMNRGTGNAFHLLFKLTQQGNLFLRHPNQVHQRTDILNQDGRQVTHQTVLHVIVRAMTASQYQSLTRKETAFRILTEVQCHCICSSPIMDSFQSFRADRNKLTFIISCSRRLGVPDDLSRPQHILFTMAHTVNITFYIFIRLYRNTLKICIIPDLAEIIFLSPLRSRSALYQFSEYTALNFFGLCPIKVNFSLSGSKYLSY